MYTKFSSCVLVKEKQIVQNLRLIIDGKCGQNMVKLPELPESFLSSRMSRLILELISLWYRNFYSRPHSYGSLKSSSYWLEVHDYLTQTL
jgi:hypothetical protein